jgi:hypothetical protein
LEGSVPSQTAPVLATTIQARPDRLVIVTDIGRFEIPWQECSGRLACATEFERGRAELSPSGYGIHWPLIDEDLAVGPLIAGRGE